MFIVPGVLSIGCSSRDRAMQIQSSKILRSMNDGSAVEFRTAFYAVGYNGMQFNNLWCFIGVYRVF